MTFEVLLTDSAAQDLEELYHHIAANDAPSKANHVLDKIEEIISRLSELPERGHIPAELRGLGIRDYREVFFKPYRIIYRIFDSRVIIYCITDGRRDMQAFLQQRLLTVR